MRKRLDARRLDFDASRLNVEDPATLKMLQQAALSPNPRQAAYALSALSKLDRWQTLVPLERVFENPSPEVRAVAFDLARKNGSAEFLDRGDD